MVAPGVALGCGFRVSLLSVPFMFVPVVDVAPVP
jgi:hypothetical protein